MDISQVILNFRQKFAMSQREFARRCNLSNSLISLLEMGINPQTGKKISPDLDTYQKLAKGMGLSLHELFEMLDERELVSLRPAGDQDAPRTVEARIISAGIDKMPPERREQALNVLRAVFSDCADLFEEKGNADEP